MAISQGISSCGILCQGDFWCYLNTQSTWPITLSTTWTLVSIKFCNMFLFTIIYLITCVWSSVFKCTEQPQIHWIKPMHQQLYLTITIHISNSNHFLISLCLSLMQESCLARNLLLSSMPHLHWFPSLSQLWNSCRWCPSQNTAHRYTKCFQKWEKMYFSVAWFSVACCMIPLCLFTDHHLVEQWEATPSPEQVATHASAPCCHRWQKESECLYMRVQSSCGHMQRTIPHEAHAMIYSAFYRQAAVSCRMSRLRLKRCSALTKIQCYWLVRLDLSFHD